ncbi:MAG: DUF4279 domain-containing protein [Flavobacteriales bacterium]
MSNKGYVYFGLYGDFVPEEVTAVIGLQPTDSVRKGESTVRVPSKFSRWRWSSEKSDDLVNVYEVSRSVVDQLIPFEKGIAHAMKQYGLEAVLQVVIFLSGEDEVSSPALGFDETVIAFLGRLNASVDVDLYKG